MPQKPPEATGVGRHQDESEAGACGSLLGVWCSRSCLELWETLGHAGADRHWGEPGAWVCRSWLRAGYHGRCLKLWIWKALQWAGGLGLWEPAESHLGPQELTLCWDSLALESGEIGHSLHSPFPMGRVSLHAGLLGLGGEVMELMWIYLSYSPQYIFSYFCASPRCCHPSAGILGSFEGILCMDSYSSWYFWGGWALESPVHLCCWHHSLLYYFYSFYLEYG